MSEKDNNTKKKCLERFELDNKPTLIITNELRNKIAFLHEKCGAIEWSGELITREEGTINDLDDWKIIAEDIFLCDIGSAAYTSYEVGERSYKTEDIMKMYDLFPGLTEGTHKQQSIHSHHSMAAFFSGTDWENLNDRGDVSNYFLMLIVNFDGKWCAKVGFKAKREGKKETKFSFANNADGYKPLKVGGDDGEEVLVVMNCKIEMGDIQVDDVFKERWEAVLKEKNEQTLREEEKRKQQAQRHQGFRGQPQGVWKQGRFFQDDWSGTVDHKAPTFVPKGWWDEEPLGRGTWKDGWWEDGTYDPGWGAIGEQKPKRISEMTEKEWNAEQGVGDGVGKFELRHAKAFLNSVLGGTYMPNDFSDCMAKIQEEEKGLLDERYFDFFVESFEENLQDHFDVLFPGKNENDYIDLLKEVHGYLLPYIHHFELVKALAGCVEEEIEFYKEPII